MSAVLKEVSAPETLSVTIPVTPEVLTAVRTEGALATAQSYAIDSAALAQAAAEERTDMAKRIDKIKAMRTDFLKPAKMLVEAAAKWFDAPIEDLEAGRALLGQKLLAWDQQEKARVAREAAEREALARKLRQEAEAKAAAERARAEEQAREARRKEQEALEAQRKAQAEGNARAAAAAAAAAAKAQEAARAAAENGEAKAREAEIQAAAQAQAVVAAVPEVVKIEGQSIKANWIAELAPNTTEDQAKAMIAAAVADKPELLGLLKLDTSAINKMAKALKSAMRVPGYVAVDRPQLAGSRK